eukprot:6490825-Prymnesium_polylepis.1
MRKKPSRKSASRPSTSSSARGRARCWMWSNCSTGWLYVPVAPNSGCSTDCMKGLAKSQSLANATPSEFQYRPSGIRSVRTVISSDRASRKRIASERFGQRG